MFYFCGKNLSGPPVKFTDDELLELTQPDGGRFRTGDDRGAFAFCRRLSLGHYENFPVGSALIPAALRPHFFSVYAFSRIADDVGDELGHLGAGAQLDALDRLEKLLEDSGNAGNPVFAALGATRKKFGIPTLPFRRLLEAFRRDVNFSQPETFAALLGYCAYSANPVGEIVLRLAGAFNPVAAPLSDAVCSALQLVNFWQDISRDFARNRMYIPKNYVGTARYDKDYLHSSEFYPKFLTALPRLLAETDEMFARGRGLLKHLPYKRLQWEIAATIGGGRRIVRKVEHLGAQILTTRPALGAADAVLIAFSVLTKR